MEEKRGPVVEWISGKAPDAPKPPEELAEKVAEVARAMFDATPEFVRGELAKGLKFRHEPPLARVDHGGEILCRVDRESYNRAVREGQVIHVRGE